MNENEKTAHGSDAIDFAEIKTQIQNHLTALESEKNEITLVLASSQARMLEIQVTERKLQTVFDSLMDLLDSLPAGEITPKNFAHAPGLNRAEPANDNETNAEIDREDESLNPGEPPNQDNFHESLIPADANNSIDAPEASEPAATMAERSADADLPTNAEKNNETAAEPPLAAENTVKFKPQEFFRRFPHLTKSHPVHLLARSILEYYGRGLKIGEIARLVESLGYRHQSNNFTDSVHSALKNKRQSSGDFRFNKELRVWELSHWQASSEEKINSNPAAGAPPRSEENAIETKSNQPGQNSSQTVVSARQQGRRSHRRANFARTEEEGITRASGITVYKKNS